MCTFILIISAVYHLSSCSQCVHKITVITFDVKIYVLQLGELKYNLA